MRVSNWEALKAAWSAECLAMSLKGMMVASSAECWAVNLAMTMVVPFNKSMKA